MNPQLFQAFLEITLDFHHGCSSDAGASVGDEAPLAAVQENEPGVSWMSPSSPAHAAEHEDQMSLDMDIAPLIGPDSCAPLSSARTLRVAPWHCGGRSVDHLTDRHRIGS